MPDLKRALSALLPDLTALRRDLHAHPELGYTEHRTAGLVADYLAALPDMRVSRVVDGTGVVATLGAQRPGPCVALRADIDALPLHETSGRPHASRTPGLAHACGHDGHTACLLGAARLLATGAAPSAGPVRFIFQPAEESGGGGRLMCEQGALDDPPVAAVFALHAWPFLPIGTVGLRSGPVMAGTDALDITILGRGTHAAAPHCGVDPIVAAAHVIAALQTVVSRLTDPAEPAVVTIGQLTGGTARNIIPDRVTMQGTLRTLSAAKREAALAAIRQVVTQTAQAFGARAQVTCTQGYPVVVNDAQATAFVSRAASAALGAGHVRNDLPVSLGGEDFAFYLRRVPGAFWRLGVGGADGAPVTPLHHPDFDFLDEALATGVRVHCAVVGAFNGWNNTPPLGKAGESDRETEHHVRKASHGG